MEQLAERHAAARPRAQRKEQPATAEKVKKEKQKNPSVTQRFVLYDTTPSHSLASPTGRALVAKLQAELVADPEKARKFFISAGLLTRSGNLTKRYGG